MIRSWAVAVVGVHRGADGKARHQPAAADAVQHGELLGDPHRRIIEGDGVAQDDDGRVRGAPRQARGDDVGRRHDAVAVLVVLINADAVEADGPGIFAQVRIGVVDLVAPGRIEQALIDIHPHRLNHVNFTDASSSVPAASLAVAAAPLNIIIIDDNWGLG